MKLALLIISLLSLFVVGFKLGERNQTNKNTAQLQACQNKTTQAEMAIKGCEYAASTIERAARIAEEEASNCKEDFDEFQKILNGAVPTE